MDKEQQPHGKKDWTPEQALAWARKRVFTYPRPPELGPTPYQVEREKATPNMAQIVAEFRDERDRTLAELALLEVFCDPDPKKANRYIDSRDPRHPALWRIREAELLAEVAALVKAMHNASNTAWVAAGKVMRIDLPRRLGDFDPNSGEI